MSESDGSSAIGPVVQLVRARQQLVRQTGREPTVGELAAEMQVSHDEVRRLMEVASGDMTFRPARDPKAT